MLDYVGGEYAGTDHAFAMAFGRFPTNGRLRRRAERRKPQTVTQTAIINLVEPTLIGATILQGPVLFTHDDKKMLKGEACTRVYLLESGTRTSEEFTAFHCIPISRRVVDKFSIRTVPNDALGFGCILTEYQFAGDAEGHGVPRTEYAN
jgi:hypothetical protein